MNRLLLLFYLTLTFACSPLKKMAIQKDTLSILNRSNIFSGHFTGLSILDLTTKEFLVNYQSDKLYTPASNTKLLTLFCALKTFGDSIPTAVFVPKDTSVNVMMLGDPTFLHPKFKKQHVFEELKKYTKITLFNSEFLNSKFGSGWAWDDYDQNYQSEINTYPIYGNSVTITQTDSSITTIPKFFEPYTQTSPSPIYRHLVYNQFNIKPSDSLASIPFIPSKNLFIELLEDTIYMPIHWAKQSLKLESKQFIYSYPTDEVLSYMMHVSDNFFAEQLLILCATLNGFTSTQSFIKYAKENWMHSLTEMRWVDGSGLSRYNLIKPIDQVRLLQLMQQEFGLDRMKVVLPTGNEGTLKKLYISDNDFLWAKTGTLSNNHNLSGYLLTNSNKTLAFSLMNNHFLSENTQIKTAMQDFLIALKESY